MRRKLIESDLVECVLGLGPEPVLQLADGGVRGDLPLVRSRRARKGKILFIDAVNEVARERAQSFLRPEHQASILAAYQDFADEPGFAAVVTNRRCAGAERQPVDSPLCEEGPSQRCRWRAPRALPPPGTSFDDEGREFWTEMDALVEMLDGVVAEEDADA